MARILFQIVFPVVLPALLYALWMTAERRRADASGTGEKPRWASAPWLWLLVLGVFFAGVLAAAIAVFGGDPWGGVYVPPELRDGRVVPGHVVPK